MSSGLEASMFPVGHKICPICFSITAPEDLFVDHDGQKWDLCSEQCARDAGWTPEGWISRSP